MGRPAIFLDRDGTLNREVDYLSRPDELELLPGVGPALRELRDAGYLLVVVTNQSGIARGLFSEATLADIHARLRDLLAAEGVSLDHLAYCPHHPSIGIPGYRVSCPCRKPEPGMLLDAARRLDLDLSASWMIGDSVRDLDAGRAAGTRGVLVRTGKGAQQEALLEDDQHASADLAEAASWILASAPPPTASP